MPTESVAIAATLMRGGTSKGLFFLPSDLPADPAARDALLLRAIGSPDPYARHIDGLGGATSSTSKVVLVQRSAQSGCDVDYLFGQVAIDQPLIDWSGSCGNLAAAVGPFALHAGLVDGAPADGRATVRIWQANLGQRIVAHVPMQGGQVQEMGNFALDGVPFPAAEIRLDFLDPAGGGGLPLLPTGHVRDTLDVLGLGPVEATLINAGNPTVIVHAAALGLAGAELPRALNADAALLARCEAVRAQAAVAMGLATTPEQATRERPATPKLALVAPPAGYVASDGRAVAAGQMDMLVRMVSMAQFHHALPGTGAIALAAAAALPGTLLAPWRPAHGGGLRMGHPAGCIETEAEAGQDAGGAWHIRRVSVSRSARRLMTGQVWVPPGA
ncbi:2-methylaconitate cis-trans isomerase PrpF [Ottowia sp.]|uniref:2-methylaconitate cis-trans isomerase PrpF n=1 Tax=Ottowia sp. TaxID=1898956 RepID=UPI0039486C0F